jgi:hypothetical protein
MVGVALKNVVEEAELLERIADAVDAAQQDLGRFSAGRDLDQLSSRTEVDHIDMMRDGIFKEDVSFTGICTFYVDLNYGQGDDAVSFPEAFPGKVHGHIDDNEDVIIDDMTVDTTSFYQ